MRELLIISAIFLSGCATILGGSHNKTSVQSNVPGARVLYNGSFKCHAPCKVKVPKSATQGHSTIIVEAEGYKRAEVEIGRKVSLGYLLADLICGFFPLAIDFATGNIYKTRPNRIDVRLQRE